MSRKIIFFQFEGNWYLSRVFTTGEGMAGLEILEMDVEKEEVILPSVFKSYPVLRMVDPKINHREKVNYLVISSSLKEFEVPNTCFPALARLKVERENPAYSTDGLSLYSKDGKKLLRAFAGSNLPQFIVKPGVEVIAEQAFAYAQIKEMVFLNPDVEVERDAFVGMHWLDSFPDEIVKVGNMLYQVRGSIPRIDLQELGLTRIHPQAFDLYQPKIIGKAHPAGEKEAGSEKKALDVSKGKKTKTVPGEEPAKRRGRKPAAPKKDPQTVVIKGATYSKDQRELLSFDPNYRLQKLVIPDTVVKVCENAFARQSFLEKVGIPGTVLEVEPGAFHHMLNLNYMRMLEGLKAFPDARESGYGVFEGCKNLTRIVLENGPEEIGDRCFAGCPLVDVNLPPVLRRIGREAFRDTAGSVTIPPSVESVGLGAFGRISYVEAYEGSAKGLFLSVFPLEGSRSYPKDEVAFTIHRKDESVPIYIPVPLTLEEGARDLLSEAWDEETLSLSALAKCYHKIQNEKERRKFGLLMLSQFPDAPEMKPIRMDLGRISHLIAMEYMERGDEDQLLELLALRVVDPGKVLRLVNKARSLGLRRCEEALRSYSAREMARKQSGA